MQRYSNDGWANLLAAVDYKNAEPERRANNEMRMMQLQALKDAHQKRTALEAYRTGLDAPVTPEITQTVPDTVASAQTDPNALYQEQPTKEVTVPPVYLNEIQKLEKMERYMAMQGNYQEAKQLNEYIKQTKEMGQHNPIVWQAWEASGGNEDKVKQILMAHGATPDQVDDIDFSMAPMGALGSKRAGMYMTRDGKTIHNAPKEANSSPTENKWIATINDPNATPEQKAMAQQNLDLEQKRKLELARAQGGIKQEQENAGIDIPAIAEAVANGQDSRVAIKNTRGNNVATKVESAVLQKYPKFDFNMADANYKWKSSQTNMRTINFAQGSLQRVAALYQQVAQLPNKSIPAINKVMREVAVNLGKPEYTNFESNRNAIVQEVNTALSGSATGSDLRVQIELENLKSARSPEQLTGAITNLYEALFARLDVDLSPIYPIEVVRGEKSMAQYKKDLYKKYKNDYHPNHNQQEVPEQKSHDFKITASTYPQEIMDKYKVTTAKANELYATAKQAWIKKAIELNKITQAQAEEQWKAKGGR